MFTAECAETAEMNPDPRIRTFADVNFQDICDLLFTIHVSLFTSHKIII